MIYLAVAFGLLLAVAIWLLWPGSGIGLVWPDAPGGPLRFRLRLRSPLAWLMKQRGVNNGVTVFGVVHIRLGSVSPTLLAHEVGHAIRATGHPWRYLWRYLTDGDWRRAEEEACWTFAGEHRDAPYLVNVARLHTG